MIAPPRAEWARVDRRPVLERAAVELGHRTNHRVAGSTKPRVHRVELAAERVGDLGRAQAFDIGEHEHLASLGLESLDREGEVIEALAIVELIVAIAFYNGVVRLLSALRIDVEDSYKPYLDKFPLP